MLNILIAVLLFAILMGISVLFNSDGVVAIMFFIWLGLIGVVNFFLNHYIGYLVKAGHVAVIAMAYQTRAYVPAKPFEMGKTMVKERFGTSNVYFAWINLWRVPLNSYNVRWDVLRTVCSGRSPELTG